MTYWGPSSSFSSSRFISCKVSLTGGVLYHDGYDEDFFCITDCLFKNNYAEFHNGSVPENIRGGGAFEDYGTSTYKSHYLFTFFTQNRAPNGAGHDISKPNRALTEENVTYCFTTTSAGALWSGGKYANWLP